VYASEKFRSYLIGSKIITFTDHAAIKYLLNEFDFEPRLVICKKPGSYARRTGCITPMPSTSTTRKMKDLDKELTEWNESESTLKTVLKRALGMRSKKNKVSAREPKRELPTRDAKRRRLSAPGPKGRK